MIKEPLNREAAEKLFKQEAIYFWFADAIPEYKMIELFGESMADYIAQNIKWDRQRMDIGHSSGREAGEPDIRYLYQSGFLRVVTEHNRHLAAIAHSESDSGKVVNAAHQREWARIERMDAEAAAREEAEKQKRKAKREAAKAAKAAREAAEKENSGGEKHNAEAKG